MEPQHGVSNHERALQLLREHPLIGQTFPHHQRGTLANANADGHNDFPYMIRGWFRNDLSDPGFNIQDLPIGQTDLTRLRKGHVGGQFWSAYVPMYLSPSFCHRVRLMILAPRYTMNFTSWRLY